MRKHILFLISIFSIFYLSSANALQVKAVKDNTTVSFKISTKDYSRIFVAGDRILSVKGRNNLYEIKEFKGKFDEGVLYIRPTAMYPKKLFSIFLTTEQGHHFTLLLGPMNVPAENIEIQPITATKSMASQWEQNLPYSQNIIDLMRYMRNATHPEGYAVINLGKVKPKQIGGGLSMQLLTLYRGGFLQGEIWKLKNESGHTLCLHPREFFQDNVRASSVIDETLEKGNETILYRVVSHG